MQASAFDYPLPPEAIAQVPHAERSAARLLVVDAEGERRHRTVQDLPSLVGPGDVLVVNDTRVRRARLRLRRATGGAVEVLLLERTDAGWWEALVRPSRRLAVGEVLAGDGSPLRVEVGGSASDGVRLVRFVDLPDETAEEAAVEAHGAVPLPPYLHAELDDPERYQTTFARALGSVAAPTAGLHLTADVLASCREAGAEIHPIELRVGIGTFRPIVVDELGDHAMHRERYAVPDETWEACRRARRVVAIGTTVVRALETAATTGEATGTSQLFIAPGYDFAVVDALLTNFHLPRSTLLVLLEAFMGPTWRSVYAEALTAGYGFLSLGDAMLVERSA